MMHKRTLGLCVVALSLSARAAEDPALGCLIEPDRVADIGSAVVSVIDRIEVDRGQYVRKGQVLVTLRAKVERAAFDAARSRADASADLQAAAANARFNRERLLRAEGLLKENFISQQALDQARTEAELADQKLAQAREQLTNLSHERAVAAAQLHERVIRSPMDGVVAERYMSAGERVDERPILRIARVDPLRVQVVVPTTLYRKVRPDDFVSVMPDLPGATAVTARVTMVDKVIDPASNTFRVQLALPNPDRSLPAGLRCRANFAPERVAARAAPSGALKLRFSAPAEGASAASPAASDTQRPRSAGRQDRTTAVAEATQVQPTATR